MRTLEQIIQDDIDRWNNLLPLSHGRPLEADAVNSNDYSSTKQAQDFDGETRIGGEYDWHPFAVNVSQTGTSVERGQVLVPKGGVNKFEWMVPTMGGTAIKDSRNDETFPTISNGTQKIWLKFTGALGVSGFDVSAVIIEAGATVPDDTDTLKYIAIADVVYTSVNNYTIEQYVKSDFSINWASGNEGNIHWRLTCGETTVSVGTGRINNILLTVAPFALTADPNTQTIYIKTTWTPFSNDVGAPYTLDGATLTDQEILAIAGIAVPASVCPLIDETLGTPTDGEYYIPIGTQGWVDNGCVTDNDNLTKSFQITFCPPCEWHYWPVAG